LKLRYITLSLLIFTNIYAKTKTSPQRNEERKNLIQKINAINAQLRNGICDEELLDNKKLFIEQILQSLKRETEKTDRINLKIKHWQTVLTELNKAKNTSIDFTMSSRKRYLDQYLTKQEHKLQCQINRIRKVKKRVANQTNKKLRNTDKKSFKDKETYQHDSTAGPSFGLNRLFKPESNIDDQKVELSTLSTIKEEDDDDETSEAGSLQEVNTQETQVNNQQPQEQNKTAPGILSRILAFITHRFQ